MSLGFTCALPATADLRRFAFDAISVWLERGDLSMIGLGIFFMNETQIFYHGTSREYVHDVLSEGFKIGGQANGRCLGNGIYLSVSAGFAAEWGNMILRCELVERVSVLWHREVDTKVLGYLKKEFGAGIIKPDFWKNLPRNKRFTRREIITLWDHLIVRCYEEDRRIRKGWYENLFANYSRIFEHLKMHRFDGVGFVDEDWPEVMIFNPSHVRIISAHHWDVVKRCLGEALSSKEVRQVQIDARSEYDEGGWGVE